MATVAIKRKRGRPRRDEPSEINDFDIALIREFAQRPAFYDRSCVHYRNRDYIEVQWEEMAKSLGYSVQLIRDRMIQLRNRYNLEKRRVETMQEQYNDPDITSQWAMYEYMSFLGEHIKTRRPFVNSKPAIVSNARMKMRHNNSNSSSNEDEDDYDESQNFTSNDSDAEQQNSNINNYKSNHIQNIKKSTSVHLENESSSNSRFCLPAPIQSDKINITTTAGGKKQLNQIKINPQTQQGQNANSTPIHERLQQQQQQQNYHQMQQQQEEQQRNYHNNHHHQRSHQFIAGVDKFKAFGQFLAASLIEMDEIDALRLVDKFTSELVRHACINAEMRSNMHQESENEAEMNISV